VGHLSGATRYKLHGYGQCHAARDTFFIQKSRNWQISHSLPIRGHLVNQFRFGHTDSTADQIGATADPADISALGLTGVFTDTLSDAQRSYPGIAFAVGGIARSGGAVNDYTTSNQPMWDISNATTWIRGSHSLIFGANYRRWKLKRDRRRISGDFTFNGTFTGQPVADFLLNYFQAALRFSRLPSAIPNRQAIRVSTTFDIALTFGRLEGQFTTDLESWITLGLSHRALRNE
jgi:hypothetical protein